MDFDQAAGQRLLLAFAGKEGLSLQAEQALREYRPAGITLFRSLNIESPAQLRELTDAFQRAARANGLPPLLIATDQEGGQLMAMGDGTPLPGNMALGAAGSERLAGLAGQVLGREMAAVGVNVNYAPCLDVNLNPRNPVVGVRSFGEDPAAVAALGAAMVRGIQSQGVAAVAKHFPGHGDTVSDSHHGMANVPHSLQRLRSVEFPPFIASIEAGVKLIMSAHLGIPALDGRGAPPATLSRNVLTSLLRGELSFDGVIVTDAMDMHAIRQGEALGGEAVRALEAGADLLLVTSDPQDQVRVYEAVRHAAAQGIVTTREMQASLGRIARLKDWLALAPPQPDLDVVRSAAHLKVAEEIAERSVTLVRDEAGLLPIRLNPEQRIAVVMPKPLDLTPADTSSYLTPNLAGVLREHHSSVDEFVIPFAPDESDIRALIHAVRGYDLIVLGTINAFDQPGQAKLVRVVLNLDIPAVCLALRLPYDLAAYPQAPVYICTYSLMEPSLKAAAKCLFGEMAPAGSLPASIPGLYPAGHRLER